LIGTKRQQGSKLEQHDEAQHIVLESRPTVNYLALRLKLTSRPTRASQVKTFNSGRSRRTMAGVFANLDFDPFVAALSPFRATTFRLGSVSQVSTGTVCVFVLITIRNAIALLEQLRA
jgi:hypothetical protein